MEQKNQSEIVSRKDDTFGQNRNQSTATYLDPDLRKHGQAIVFIDTFERPEGGLCQVRPVYAHLGDDLDSQAKLKHKVEQS